MAFYLDTSAMVKLVIAEPETAALRAWVADSDRQPVTCDLTRTELIRAVRRRSPELLVEARSALDGVILTKVTVQVFEAAARLEPASLRSLDAVHVASALDLGDDLDGIVAYDDRLIEAARANAIRVLSPA